MAAFNDEATEPAQRPSEARKAAETKMSIVAERTTSETQSIAEDTRNERPGLNVAT